MLTPKRIITPPLALIIVLLVTCNSGELRSQETTTPSSDAVKLFLNLDDYVMMGYYDFCVASQDLERTFLLGQRRTLTDAERTYSTFLSSGENRVATKGQKYYRKLNRNLSSSGYSTLTYDIVDEYYYEEWHRGLIPPRRNVTRFLRVNIPGLESDVDMQKFNDRFLNPIHRKVYFDCPTSPRIDAIPVIGDYSEQLLALAILRGRIAYKNYLLSTQLRKLLGSSSSNRLIETNYVCLTHEINYQIAMLIKSHASNNISITRQDLDEISYQEFRRIRDGNFIQGFSKYDQLYTLRPLVEELHDKLIVSGLVGDTKIGIDLEDFLVIIPVVWHFIDAGVVTQRATDILREIGEINPIPFNQNLFLYKLGLDVYTVADQRDGQRYGTARIGDQIWMTENLNYVTGKGSWCYNNISLNCKKFGRLYTYEAATTVCPKGWHLPTLRDWVTFYEFMSQGLKVMPAPKSQKEALQQTLERNIFVGTKLLEDVTGFNPLLGGYREYDGSYIEMGKSTGFWGYDELIGKPVFTIYNNGTEHWAVISQKVSYEEEQYGFCVRCLKDK